MRAGNKRVADGECGFYLSLMLLGFGSIASAEDAVIEREFDFNISQQAANTALVEFAEQADLTLVFPDELVLGKSANALIGTYTRQEGIDVLLAGTGLTPKFSNKIVLSISTDEQSANEGETMNVKKKAGLLAVLAGVFAGGANAQDIATGENADVAEARLEEIIVTAQKRQESLQSVPLSIAAFTSEQLENSIIQDIYDVGIQTPGMIVNKEIVGKIYIRGIGAENLTIGGDPGVAVHADGAYIARTSAAMFDLYDVERVEVLRGPQGTLYGRNATGGIVNIVSKTPTEEFEGSVSAEFGDFDYVRLGAVVSGPLAEGKVLARAAIVKSDRDGFTPNLFTGEDLFDEDLLMGRLRLRFLASDDVTIDLIADFSQDDSSPAPFKQLEFSDLFEGALGATDPPGLRSVSQESPVTEMQDQFGITAIVNWDIGDSTFTSVSSYRDTEFKAVFDGDAVDITFQNFENHDDTQQFSQEFRLASDASDRWSWIIGAFYFNDDGDTEIFIPIPGFGFDILHRASMLTDAYAVFGQTSYSVSDRLSLTAGLRYNSEEKEATQLSEFIGLFPPFPPALLSTDSDEFTPKFGIEYEISDEVMWYATVTRGFKSGGFTFNGIQPDFKPEFVWAYETGFKSTLAEGSVILNGSAFFYDYTDLQVSKLENNAGVITNAADATIFGAELELLAQATERWRFNVGLSFLSAEFDRFLTEDPSNPQLGTIDLDGNNLPRSPEFSANVGTDYTVPVGAEGDLSFRVDYQYQDESFFTTFNRQLSAQDAFSLLNARVSYAKNDGSWTVAAFVRNAFDEDYFLNILESGVETGKPEGFLAAPRTYGIQLSYNF